MPSQDFLLALKDDEGLRRYVMVQDFLWIGTI
jgi:hypothetical protein